MNSKVEHVSSGGASSHPQGDVGAQSSGGSSAKFVTLQNIDALQSWGMEPARPPIFSEEDLQRRRMEFHETYGISQDSCLMADVHETNDSMSYEKPIYFCNFPEELIFLEEKVEYSAANPDKLFTSVGETYRRVELECFLNGVAIRIEVPVGSYDSADAIKMGVSRAANHLDAFVANESLERLASLSNAEHRLMVRGGLGEGNLCSIAIYPERLIGEKGDMPLERALYALRRGDVKHMDVSMDNIPFDELLK